MWHTKFSRFVQIICCWIGLTSYRTKVKNDPSLRRNFLEIPNHNWCWITVEHGFWIWMCVCMFVCVRESDVIAYYHWTGQINLLHVMVSGREWKQQCWIGVFQKFNYFGGNVCQVVQIGGCEWFVALKWCLFYKIWWMGILFDDSTTNTKRFNGKLFCLLSENFMCSHSFCTVHT